MSAAPTPDIVDLQRQAAEIRERTERQEAQQLLEDLEAFLTRFVVYPSEHARVAHLLWCVHAHLMGAWESTPRLAFLSPEPGSGKTRGLEITELLVPRPVEAVNTTAAYLFRKVADPEGLPTLLYDEIDTLFGPRAKENEDIRGMLNAGHRRGAVAGRCTIKGKAIVTEELPAYCAVALAGLGNLPDTIFSRSVIIRMRRRAPSETIEPYRRREHSPAGHELRDRLATWAVWNVDELASARPAMPEGVTDRAADVWEPLLAIADHVGGTWPERARVTAVTLVTDAMAASPSLGVRLLTDLQTVFGEREAISTNSILDSLVALEDSPWGELRGKPLDARGLARLLSKYGVTRSTFREGMGTVKGYRRTDLRDAWARYVGPPDKGSVTTVTTETSNLPLNDPASKRCPACDGEGCHWCVRREPE